MSKYRTIKWGIGIGLCLLIAGISIWCFGKDIKESPSTVYAKDSTGQWVPCLELSEETVGYEAAYYRQILGDALQGKEKRGGYKLYSTIDLALQTKLTKMFEDFTIFANTRQIDESMEAVMIVTNPQNEIVAMASRGPHTTNPYLRSYKVGSTIKPLSIYSLALEKDIIHYSMQVMDEPSLIQQGEKSVLWPQNNGGRQYGVVTIEEAIMRSLNTIPVQLGIALTPEKCYDFLKTLQFSTLQPEDRSLSALCLGEFKEGLHLQELVGAFQLFTNQGVHENVRQYTTIEDGEGNVVVDTKAEGTQLIGSDTATIMNRLLQQVVETEGGTGVQARMQEMPVIGKTGTSDQGMDYLFVGATPYYKSVLWLGYPYPESRSPRYNYKVTQIWNTLMEECHTGLAPKTFVLDEQVVERDYCQQTGYLAQTNCPSVRRGYYKEGKVPTPCNTH